jgi:hypothetical protein
MKITKIHEKDDGPNAETAKIAEKRSNDGWTDPLDPTPRPQR